MTKPNSSQNLLRIPNFQNMSTDSGFEVSGPRHGRLSEPSFDKKKKTKIDEIWEIADFLDCFFSFHAVRGWNHDREQLPATQGTLTQHSGSLLSIFGVAGGPICAYGKTRFRYFQAILRPFVLLSPCSALEWPGTTFSNPRHPHTTLWVTFEFIRGGRGAVCAYGKAQFRDFQAIFRLFQHTVKQAAYKTLGTNHKTSIAENSGVTV